MYEVMNEGGENEGSYSCGNKKIIFLFIQLDYTHDPIADFINAVQSDVIAFGSQRR